MEVDDSSSIPSASSSSGNECTQQGFSESNPCVVYVLSNCKQQTYVPPLPSPASALLAIAGEKASTATSARKTTAATDASKKRKASPLQHAQTLDAVLADDENIGGDNNNDDDGEDDSGGGGSKPARAPSIATLSCAHFRIASYAIWFGADDARNECTTLDASLHMTPAHAQLLALERALLLTMHIPYITIVTPGNSTTLNTEKVLKVLGAHATQGWRQPLTKHANVWRSVWLSNVYWRQSCARLPPVNLQMVKNDASNAERRAIFTTLASWLRAHNTRLTNTLATTWAKFQLPASACL